MDNNDNGLQELEDLQALLDKYGNPDPQFSGDGRDSGFEQAWEKLFSESLKKPQADSRLSIQEAGGGKGKAIEAVEKAAKDVLPDYNGWGDALLSWDAVNIVYSLAGYSIGPILLRIFHAYATAKLSYQSDNAVDKNEAMSFAHIADNAYNGDPKAEGFEKIASDSVPTELKDAYDSDTGVLDIGEGLKAWMGMKGDTVALAFCGTLLNNADMVKADVAQLLLNSKLYYRGAGLLNIVLKKFTDKKIIVTGHSLGGGLTQFSVAANIKVSTAVNALKGYSYNPAGLSKFSLDALGDERLTKAKDSLYTFMTKLDPVSTFGGKLGTCITLPFCFGHNLHGIADVIVCMEKYRGAKDVSLLDVEAYEFTDTPYILADGNHCIVVTKNKKPENGEYYCWDNYGRDYNDEGIKQYVTANKVYKEWLLNFCEPPKYDNCGLEFGVSGVCQNYAARELLIGIDDTSLERVGGNDVCLLWFGKYGLGIDNLKKLVKESYAKTVKDYVLAQKCLDDVINRIDDSMEDELKAWYNVGQHRLGIPIDDILDKGGREAGIEVASSRLKSWMEERESIFSQYGGKGELNNKLKEGMLKAVKDYLDFLQGISLVTETESDTYYSKLKDMLDKYVAQLGTLRIQYLNQIQNDGLRRAVENGESC